MASLIRVKFHFGSYNKRGGQVETHSQPAKHEMASSFFTTNFDLSVDVTVDLLPAFQEKNIKWCQNLKFVLSLLIWFVAFRLRWSKMEAAAPQTGSLSFARKLSRFAQQQRAKFNYEFHRFVV